MALCFHRHARQTPFEIKATPKGPYTVDITYRPAKCEDLEDAERVVQEAGNELRVRHGRQPWPAPPPIAFPKFCLAEGPDGLGPRHVVTSGQTQLLDPSEARAL